MELIVRYGDREERVEVLREASGYRVRLGGVELAVDAVATGESTRSLIVDGRQHEVSVRASGGSVYEVETASGRSLVEVLDPLAYLAGQSQVGSGKQQEQITAYMPGRVVTLLVAEGDEVNAGQGLIVLEAMKMENEIAAEHAGVIKKIHVEPNQAVEGGDVLLELV